MQTESFDAGRDLAAEAQAAAAVLGRMESERERMPDSVPVSDYAAANDGHEADWQVADCFRSHFSLWMLIRGCFWLLAR